MLKVFAPKEYAIDSTNDFLNQTPMQKVNGS